MSRRGEEPPGSGLVLVRLVPGDTSSPRRCKVAGRTVKW